MSIEKIDDAGDKDSFTELIELVTVFLQSNDTPIKDRLLVERKIKEYQDKNTQDWLLNLLLAVHKNVRQKETHREGTREAKREEPRN